MAEKATKKTRNKAAAATAEVEPEAKELEFKGLDFVLPAELPETIFFDLSAFETAEADPRPVFRLLGSILGDQQTLQLRNAVAQRDDLSLGDLMPLIETIFDQYGMSPGEAQASQDS